jgi:FixJ family two-component response regulator
VRAHPELDGLTLQELLGSSDSQRQVIFLSGNDDVEAGVRAMKAGAIDYLTKPAQDSVVLAAVAHAIDADQKARQERHATQDLQRLFAKLTEREKDVFKLVVRGYLNKQIAFELGIVEKTVKVHRSRAMQKLEVRSFAQLLWAGRRLGLVDSAEKE